jgi:hypothetical protein
MGIQRKEPVRVIKDYNESVPFQPVCIDDGPGHDRVNGTPLDRLDFDASALHIGVEGRMLLTAEERDNAPISRPRQCPFHPMRGDSPGRRSDCGRAAALFQFAQQTVDTRRRSFQLLQGMFVRLFFMSDLSEIDLLFLLDRFHFSELLLGRLLIRYHPDTRFFPLPLGLFHTGHIGSKRAHERIIPFGYGREILEPALEIAI